MLVLLLSLFNLTLTDGDEFFYNGQYSDALNVYRTVEKRGEGNAEMFFNMGVCYEKLGNIRRALKYYKKSGTPLANERIKKIQPIIHREDSIKALKAKAKERKKDSIKASVQKDTLKNKAVNTVTIDSIGRDSVKKDTLSKKEYTPKESGLLNLLVFLLLISFVLLVLSLGFTIYILKRQATSWQRLKNMIVSEEKGFVGFRKQGLLLILFFSFKKINRCIVEEKSNGDTVYYYDIKALRKFFGERDYSIFVDFSDSEWRSFADTFIELFTGEEEL